MPAALWGNKIAVWSNRKLFLLAASKRQHVSLQSEILAVQIHIELATNCWTGICWGTARGCFQTQVQTKRILGGGWMCIACLWACERWHVTQFPHPSKYTQCQMIPTCLAAENTRQLHDPPALLSPWSLPRARPVVCMWPSSGKEEISVHVVTAAAFSSFTRVLGEVGFAFCSWIRCCVAGIYGVTGRGY